MDKTRFIRAEFTAACKTAARIDETRNIQKKCCRIYHVTGVGADAADNIKMYFQRKMIREFNLG